MTEFDLDSSFDQRILQWASYDMEHSPRWVFPIHTGCVTILSPERLGKVVPSYASDNYFYIQRGPKVTSLVARSSRGRCAQHCMIRGRHDAHRPRILRVIYKHLRDIQCAKFTPDSRRTRVTSANPPQMLRAPAAQQGLLLLNPSVALPTYGCTAFILLLAARE
jgi:hypothetical protein